MRKYILIIATALAFYCCGDDLGSQGVKKYQRQGHGVFVCNEGTYTSGNASLTYYDPANSKSEREIFFNANGFPMGDVCVSMNIIDGTGYAVINNSGRITLIDPVTFRYKGFIKGLVSPRAVHKATAGKLYISDLMDPAITVVDINTLETIGRIDLGTNPDTGLPHISETFVSYGNKVFVCSWSNNNKVFVIDTDNDQIVETIQVTNQPNSIVIDRNNKIWVLSDGGNEWSYMPQVNAALNRIDPETYQVELTVEFPDINSSPQKLCIDPTGSRLYFLNSNWSYEPVSESGLYSMDITGTALPSQPLVAESGRTFYGLGVDPVNSDVYVGDAVDYVNAGTVYRYSSSGMLIDQFVTGTCPGNFCFKQ